MYQIAELTLYSSSGDVTYLDGPGEDVVPNMLNKLVHILTKLVRNNKEQAERVSFLSPVYLNIGLDA